MMVERFESKGIQLRRIAVARLIKAVMPFDAKGEIPGTFTQFDGMIRMGRRPVGLVPHFSMKTFL